MLSMDRDAPDLSDLAITAIVGGLVAGIVMGLILSVGNGIMATIGQFTGEPSPWIGWIVHLGFSIVSAAGFLLVLSMRPIEVAFRNRIDTMLLAIVYSALLASSTWGFVIPVFAGFWGAFPLSATPDAMSVAQFTIILGVGHLIWGLVVGAIVVYRHSPMPLIHDKEDSVEGSSSE